MYSTNKTSTTTQKNFATSLSQSVAKFFREIYHQIKIYFKINNIANTYIIGVSFLVLPLRRFNTTYEIIPNRIPLEIE